MYGVGGLFALVLLQRSESHVVRVYSITCVYFVEYYIDTSGFRNFGIQLVGLCLQEV